LELLEKVVGITAAVIGVIVLIFLYPIIIQLLIPKEPEAPTPPVAIISAMQDGYVGEELSFSAAQSMDPDGRIIDHQWDFGDGQRGFGPMPVHVYQSPGDYKVTLTVIDDDQKNSVAQTTVRVLPRPVVEEAPKPAVQEAQEPAEAAVAVATEAKCDSKSNNWCYRILDASVSKQVAELGEKIMVQATISENQTGKNNLIISLVVTGPGIENEIPKRIIDTEKAGTYKYEEALKPEKAGKYQVLLQIIDVDDNILDSRQIEFDVVNPPSVMHPVAEISFSPNTIFVNTKVDFSAANSSDPDGRIVRYHWSFGDGSLAYGRQVSHVFTTPGEFNVVLIVMDDGGQKSTTSVTISIQRDPR